MGDKKLVNTDYAKQPYPLSKIKGSLSLNQQKILVGMMDFLDAKVGDLLKRRPQGMKLFNAEDLDEDGNVVVDIPLSSVTSRPDEYRDIEKVAPLLVEARIAIDRGDSIEYMNSFTSLTVPKSRGKEGRRQGFVRVKMSQYQANTMFDFTRWASFRTSVAHHCKSAYTLKIYLTLSEERFRGECTVDYSELRRDVGCDVYDKDTDTFEVKKYKDYKNFHLRVLQTAEKELKQLADDGWSDFYFTFTPIYKGKGSMRTDPESIKFTIHMTQQALIEDNNRKLSLQYITIEKYIVENFELNKADVASVLKIVADDVAEQFFVRVKEIDASIKKQGDKIRDKRKYALKSLHDAALEFVEILTEADASETGVSETDGKASGTGAEKDERWSRVVELLKGHDSLEGMKLCRDKDGAYVEIGGKLFAELYADDIRVVMSNGLRVQYKN